MGRELGLDEVHAGLLPAGKVELVEALLKEKSPRGNLAFVGDGINDAPVLSRADIGIAMGGLGSDAAIEAADVVLMDDKPSKIATAMRNFPAKPCGLCRQNIVFALAIKAAGAGAGRPGYGQHVGGGLCRRGRVRPCHSQRHPRPEGRKKQVKSLQEDGTVFLQFC